MSVHRSDPNAIVETTGGNTQRFKGTREDVSVDYEKLLTYQDGSTKMLGVRVTTNNRGGRSFTVTGREGQVGKDEATYLLDGDVRLAASDGLTAETEHASYQDKQGIVRAPGPVSFGRGRMKGHGLGMTYDKNNDVITLLDQAVVQMAADDHGAGAADITAGSAAFDRRTKQVHFEREVKVLREGQVIEADTATAYLTLDEKRVDSLELRGHSRITAAKVAAGGLKALTGRDMNLKYADDGQSLQHAVINGDASIQLAGDPGRPGRQISATLIDITLASDGTTPTHLAGRDAVRLTFPAEQGAGTRTIRAATLDAAGEPDKGLTSAHFEGNVEFHEVNGDTERVARSAVLDVALKPGMSSFDNARFFRTVRFAQGDMTAAAASIRYLPDAGQLQLRGVEDATPVPHVVNDRIAVDATTIDVTLEGPKMKAAGTVKSVLQPPKKSAKPGEKPAETNAKMPSMLKQDQPVNVTGDALDYDGSVSKATYTGHAQLWQADTAVRANTLVIDDKTGDLSGDGDVATSVILEQTNKTTKAKERVRSLGTSATFKYDEDVRRATYTTDAHLTGPEGDITANRIELYLKASGDELDRAEAYDTGNKMTLRETGRTTNGNRLTYTAADDRYVVTGTPVKVVDECARETIGRTLIFYKATDTILVDGNQRIRTQTKDGGKCPPGSPGR